MSELVPARGRRRTVVTALPLEPEARGVLADTLGPEWLVLDIRDDVDRADLVLAPSCSPQAIAALNRAFPDAELIVVELDDWELGVRLGGPVRRALDAGASAYHVARSTRELGDFLTSLEVRRAAQHADPQHTRALPDASVDDLVIRFADRAAARRR